MAVVVLLQQAAETAASGGWLGTVIAIVPLLVGLALAIIKIIRLMTSNEQTLKKLDQAETIVVTIGESINDVTPLLGVDYAKRLKGAIRAKADERSVTSDLEALLKRHGLNDTSTAKLAAPPS